MRRARPGDAIGLVVLTLALCAYLLQAALFIRHVNDDAYITFRYSRFLATGLGPYFNPGEHVEGYTSLLQMLLLAAVYGAGGEAAVPPAAKALGIAAGAATLILAFLIGRLLARQSAGLEPHAGVAGGLAAGLVAVFPGYALNSTSGLETAPFAALLALGVWLALRADLEGRWRGAGLAWGAAALTRPEGAAVFGAHWLCGLAARSARERRPAPPAGGIKDLAIVALVVAAHTLFRVLAYDGELLPNTYWAKALGFWGRTPWEYVRLGALAPFLGPVGAALGLAGLAVSGGAARRAAPAAGAALFGAGLPFLVGADWMPGWRFAVPYLAILAALLATGWARLLRPIAGRHAAIAPAVALAAMALLGFLHRAERREFRDLVELRADGYETGHRRLARWIRDEAAGPGDAVALMDIGIVGYACPRQRILDITGLTDRHIAKSPGTFLKKEYDPAYILDQRPEVVVVVLSAFEIAPTEVGGEPRSVRRVLAPSGPLPEEAQIGTWIRIEAEILAHPAFEAAYRRPREDPGPAAPWTERLAARYGAERVFEHAHPDQYYLLAAFRRQPPARGR